MTIRHYRNKDNKTKDIAVLLSTGHFLTGDQMDALTMRAWTMYKHRTPAEKLSIIVERDIAYNSTRGIQSYVYKH